VRELVFRCRPLKGNVPSGQLSQGKGINTFGSGIVRGGGGAGAERNGEKDKTFDFLYERGG